MSDSTNIPEFSVSEISGAVRRTLETSFSRVRVRGEITEFKTYPSGHSYLSLKDDGGKIRAVIWKGAKRTIGVIPENGMEVIATGKVTAYGDRSEYQLSIDRLDYAGVGAMLARIEALRVKLMQEGLFAPERKQAIPLLPSVVGVITSPKGAVIHDIMTTIARRFARPILLWPVAVQGEGAADQIASAIAAMDSLPRDGIARPDVLIVARGGGSLEDLMAFNDERVVRAASLCRLPLISAVGHETDTTLIDFASDRRAPTPTAAAEMAVPVQAELRANLTHAAARLQSAWLRLDDQARHRLRALAQTLPDLPTLLAAARQRLDDRGERLPAGLSRLIALRRAQLQAPRLAEPASLTARLHVKLSGLSGRLAASSPARQLQHDRQRLDLLRVRLDAASYERTLARGFALVRDDDGKPVTEAAAAQLGQKLTVHFRDGKIGAVVEQI